MGAYGLRDNGEVIMPDKEVIMPNKTDVYKRKYYAEWGRRAAREDFALMMECIEEIKELIEKDKK